MPPNSAHGKLDTEETNAAAWQATRGAVTGAARVRSYPQFFEEQRLSVLAALLTGPIVGHIFRRRGWHCVCLFTNIPWFDYTIQSVSAYPFLQMSGMIFGSVIEADERLRIYGERSRRQKVMARDAAVWRRYEEEFESLGIQGVTSEARTRKDRPEEQQEEK
ncbi:hypothetical protein E4T38_07371 [Aureobasidium subglaciale]|nr:hypothetical protein E4T38_07371 [Aureobasidium subglaciale]KAI5217421.1 hypothetical protein E4T40_07382 [Aureobasidium subglaciale]KAI5221041.1 hypothetical protein E4T41_07223 [Aureobasidium subglaciale]KAI5258579.1 hypothetical protein E4T46_07200 [Aureobasidium subglaciale]